MKKLNIFLLLSMACIGCTKQAICQQIVHDPVAFVEMLDQKYNQLVSIENQFKQLEYLYEQVQYQIRSLEKLDFSSYEAIRKYTRSRYNGIKNLNSQVRNLQLKIGNERYRLNDVLPPQDEIDAYFSELYQAHLKGDRNRVEEIEAELKELKNLNYTAGIDTAAEVMSLSGDTAKFHADSVRRLEELSAQIENTDSLVGQLQINNYLLAEIALLLERIAQGTERANKMTATDQIVEMLRDYEKNNPAAPAAAPLPQTSDEFKEYEEKTFMPDFSM